MKRFLSLLKIDVAEQRKGLIIAVSIILGIHFIIYLSSSFTGPGDDIHLIFFANALFILGLIATSLIFRDFHNREEAYFSLTLPGSPLEKYISRFLITTVGYVLGGLVVYFIYSTIAMGISYALFRQSFGVFNPFTLPLWKMIAGYVVAHSVFFFGSVYFKKAAYLKTLLSIIVILLIFSIVATIITALSTITWIGQLIPLIGTNIPVLSLPNTDSLMMFFNIMGRISTIFFCYIMTPALWVLGYIRFKEIEVR